ncbi:flagellar biosynthesis anti-sigma factor FlgM [Sphingomonas gilva]|nr:flagellar biosynthesis anti-sigma factor FlgM [Sphingomonas gilva]
MIKGIGPANVGRPASEAMRVAGEAKAVDRANPARTADSAAAAPSLQVKQMVADGPPVAADRVAALRAAIAGGSYRIDADAIADRMVENDFPEGGR